MNQKDAVEKIESMGDCDNCSYYRKVARDILFKVERLGHLESFIVNDFLTSFPSL